MSVFDIFKQLDAQKAQQPSGPVQYIVCGLGNPGTQYENTRHNAGFMAIDTIAEKIGADAKKLKFKSLTADVTLGGVRCLLMKPSTFMNNSGEAVAIQSRCAKNCTIPEKNQLNLFIASLILP